MSVDSKARVITAVKVTPAAVSDERVLPDLVEGQPIKPKEVGADTIYGIVDNYAYLFAKGILQSIPRRPTPGWRYTGGFSTDNFIYDERRDIFVCPGDQVLKRKGHNSYRHWTTYQARKGCVKGVS